MADTKTFKSYNFVTGAVDGTLAYDFGNPKLYPQEEIYETPRRRQKTESQVWIKEDAQEEALPALRERAGLSPLSLIGSICVAVLIALMLLAQIQLLSISSATVELENQIAQLQEQQDKLAAEYETVFNMKDVEEYALGVLGMQEPEEEQIRYLTGVSAADQAVIISQENTRMFSRGMEDIVASVKAYFD